jgi:hypothetical protein
VRALTSLDLHEFSFTALPSNRLSRVSEVKQLAELPKTWQEHQAELD